MFAEELEVACSLAIAAGKAAMSFYGTVERDLKEGGSPVTEADHASNSVILEGLRESFPLDPILSEESPDPAARLGSERVWIVDPLDGTKEFLSRNGEFSIMIGLSLGGEPVLGAVYLPAEDSLYYGAVGHGTCVARAGRHERIELSGRSSLPSRMIVSRSHPDPLLKRMQEELGIADTVPCGSVGVKCVRILEDVADLYVHPVAYLSEWDTCAPDALMRQAGGHVTDCLGAPLLYNKPVPVQPDGILVQPAWSDETVETIQRVYTTSKRGES